MKHNLLMISLCALIAIPAFANDMQMPPMGAQGGSRGGMGMPMMQNLTEEQRACIEQYGCQMPEMQKPEMGETPDFGARPEKPANGEMPQRPEMSEEQKSAMECMQNAMAQCGIEMPSKPDTGNMPQRPNGERGVVSR